MADPDEAALERTVELVFAFVEDLRVDYEFGLHQFVAVQELLFALAERGALPAEPSKLEGYLRPILCSKKQEQADFGQRYRDFLALRAAAGERVSVSNEPLAQTRSWESLRRRSLLANAAMFLLGAVIVVSLGFAVRRILHETSNPPTLAAGAKGAGASSATVAPSAATLAPPAAAESGAPHVAHASGGDAATQPSASVPFAAPTGANARRELPSTDSRPLAAAILAVGFLLLVLRALYSRRQAAAFLTSGVAPAAARADAAALPKLPDAETVVIALAPRALHSAKELRATSLALRARRPSGQSEIDLAHSMAESARSAGMFSEVRRQIQRIPEYLFLIDRSSPFDFECARYDELLDALARSGIVVQRFYFERDASIVFPRDPLQRPRPLSELESSFQNHRVGILSDVAHLFDPICDQPAPWLLKLTSWATPALLTSARRDRELARVQRLEALGIRLFEASPAGLQRAFGEQRRFEVPAYVPAPPAILRDDERAWLGPDPPEPGRLARALDQIRYYLGKDGYLWLSACALYPQLRWGLATALAAALGISLEPERVRRLGSLPWARAARMPAWLRARLLADLSSDEREHVRRGLEQVLVAGAYGGGSGARLEVLRAEPGLVRSLYRELVGSWRRADDLGSPLEDRVFIGSMADNFALRAPTALRNVGHALAKRVRSELPERDAAQRAYAALLIGYLFQLIALVLSKGFSSWSDAAAATLIALGAAFALALLEKPPSSVRDGALRGLRTLLADMLASAIVVFAVLLGSSLPFVNGNASVLLGNASSQGIVFALGQVTLLGAPLALFARKRARWLSMLVGFVLLAASQSALTPVRDTTGNVLASAVFSPDGQRVVTASSDSTARIWDARSGKELAKLEGHSGDVRSARFSPDGLRVATAQGTTARIWDARSGKELAKLEGHSGDVRSARFSPDGQRVLTASSDETARIWDAASGKQLAVLEGHSGSVTGALFSPDGQRVVTASQDNTARIWDAASGKPLATLHGHSAAVTSALFSPDGQRVLTASDDGTDGIWDAVSGKELVKLGGRISTSASAGGSSADAMDLDLDSGSESARFSPDGQRVVTTSHGSPVRIWDAASGKEMVTLEGASASGTGAMFSPDGQRVLVASEAAAGGIWDAATGKQLARLNGDTDSVRSALFSPDGRRVVTTSWDNAARIWDAATGKQLSTLGPAATIGTSALFSNVFLRTGLPQKVVMALGLGLLFATFTRLLPRRVKAFTGALREWVDRFSLDRLLFDQQAAPLLAPSRLRTALAAVGVGFVLGVGARFAATQGLHGELHQGLTELLNRAVVLLLCAAVFLTYPHLAALRYRARNTPRAESRAGYEYALCVLVALIVAKTNENTSEFTIPVLATVPLAILNWLLCRWLRPAGSEYLRSLLDRSAPDRLPSTKPFYFAGVYVEVLFLAWSFWSPQLASSTSSAPEDARAVRSVAANAETPAPSARVSAGGANPLVGTTSGGAESTPSSAGSPANVSASGGSAAAAPGALVSPTASGNSATTVRPSRPSGASGGGRVDSSPTSPLLTREELSQKLALRIKLTKGAFLADEEKKQLRALCLKAADRACIQQLSAPVGEDKRLQMQQNECPYGRDTKGYCLPRPSRKK